MEELSTIYDNDDFIDMKVCFSSSSPLPNLRTRFSRDDFEFQIMSSYSIFADELFRHGMLLPQQTYPVPGGDDDKQTTVFSHVVSSILAGKSEKNLVDEDYCFFEWSNGGVARHRKRSENWSKRLYRHALTTSKKYLKSLFSKTIICDSKKDDGVVVESHRSSFSFSFSGTGTDTMFFPSSSSSSSSSSTPTMPPRSSSSTLIITDEQDNTSFKRLKKRSSSARFEVEDSIKEAIAYCKRSYAL